MHLFPLRAQQGIHSERERSLIFGVNLLGWQQHADFSPKSICKCLLWQKDCFVKQTTVLCALRPEQNHRVPIFFSPRLTFTHNNTSLSHTLSGFCIVSARGKHGESLASLAVCGASAVNSESWISFQLFRGIGPWCLFGQAISHCFNSG